MHRGGIVAAWCAAACTGLFVTGCAGTDGRVPVTGTVAIDGKPAAGVTVWFHPSPETKGNGGYADTDAAGRFTATTHQARPGLYPGDYGITLTSIAESSGRTEGEPVTKIPAAYMRLETTPWRITIDGRQGPLDLVAKTGGE